MTKKILIIGLGYVGLSQAVLLHKNNHVDVIDTNKDKTNLIHSNKSPLKEAEYKDYFKNTDVNLGAFSRKEDLTIDYDFVLLCLPTDYDYDSNELDTSVIESYIEFFINNSNSKIIIKSTIPIGFTQSQLERHNSERISFSPEFLREGSSLDDVMNPSRVIYGPRNSSSNEFNEIIKESYKNSSYETRFMHSSEAEAVKLFSNTYLALRVAFFNELDNFSIKEDLNTENIIKGICDDERIGMYYNNPSFGFGGYCLPKDSKELSSFLSKKDIPANLIKTINHSNLERKKFISQDILINNPEVIGIYRISMKANSTNFRYSSTIDILDSLKNENVKVMIYEPLIKDTEIYGCSIEKDLNRFKEKADLIISNRIDDHILDVIDKVYSRDIFKKD